MKDFLKILGGAVVLTAAAVGSAMAEEDRQKRETTESFGLLPLDWFDLRTMEGREVLIRIRPNGQCEDFKKSVFGWSMSCRFKANPGLPEFREIELSGILRMNHTLNATLITKSGMRMTGSVMVVRK